MVDSPPCSKCYACCCRNSGTWKHAVKLSSKDASNPVLKAAAVPDEFDANGSIPFRADGACVFLDSVSNRCTVYDMRPKACRAFNCRNHGPDDIFMKNNPGVLAIL